MQMKALHEYVFNQEEVGGVDMCKARLLSVGSICFGNIAANGSSLILLKFGGVFSVKYFSWNIFHWE